MPARSVAVVTLGCARNDVDSEELAGRLVAAGWSIAAEPADADAVLVNTCGFIEAAKRDSIDAVLEVADEPGRSVVAVGCLAERYGATLARVLPEAAAVLSFDDYDDIATRLADVVAGRPRPAHQPRDRRRLLPVTPVARQPAPSGRTVLAPGGLGPATAAPGVAGAAYDATWAGPSHGPRLLRHRLGTGPVAPLKLASGCDRRCAFCAIPSFRGSFVSRRPEEVLAEAHELARSGVRELVLVSENSTSYGKDLGDLRLLEALLPDLAAVPGVVRVRVSYLQPAELRPSLVDALTSTPGVAPYFDLSFQHGSPSVLRRMRRFGGTERFLSLLADIRAAHPAAGVRSNVIVGFPGERKADVMELERFLTAARLDAVGVFGYSDEDGTEAVRLPGKVRRDAVARRLERLTRLVEELSAQRAEDRVGEVVEVLVENVDAGGAFGRAAHQAPEVDGSTIVTLGAGRDGGGGRLRVGDLVHARVTGTVGVDLRAELLRVAAPGPPAAPTAGPLVGPVTGPLVGS